jgi:hypothetical protein
VPYGIRRKLVRDARVSFYRTIERGLWGDEIIAACSWKAKLLFVYLCCNEHDDLSGIYRLSPTIVNEELSLDLPDFFEALSELERRVTFDGEVSVVWVHNMLMKTSGGRDGDIGAKHLEHTRRQLAALPRSSLKLAMVEYYRDFFGIEIGYLEVPGGCRRGSRARARASVSASASASGSESVSEGECEGEAPTPPFVHKGPPAVLADPVAAAHCQETRSVIASPPPRGCRPWGPGDATEIHRQLRAHGSKHIGLVVSFVAAEIRDGRAEPKVWSHLWRYDGEPFERWAQRYAEASAASPPAPEMTPAQLVEEDARRAGMSEAMIKELVAKVAEGTDVR